MIVGIALASFASIKQSKRLREGRCLQAEACRGGVLLDFGVYDFRLTPGDWGAVPQLPESKFKKMDAQNAFECIRKAQI